MNLKNLASVISIIYKKNPKVEAVLLAGSVSRNWEDEFSDIELLIFWKEEPTDEDRKIPIQILNGRIIDFHDFEDEEWAETYITNNVKLEISSFLTKTIERAIEEVTLNFETSFDLQCLIASVHFGVPLYGELMIATLKEKVSEYPKSLSEAMILEHIDFGNRWNNREALLSRKDWLMFYKVVDSVQTNIMALLFGLNRQYVIHPGFKWQKNSLETMENIPENALERLELIFTGDPEAGLKELELIIQDIYLLIQAEYPNLDLSPYINKSEFLRPKRV
ncbi:DUF4037 domain-containing protein [Bacillus sp. EAC]|uniref:DUF4037 domain-containing protein n=1 Tax=Bacillus sp. EAC TaxID=1978338 RepID=UPI000B441520|nr:DUF4037 domain-containing protein [Bacillus sp. EAC]